MACPLTDRAAKRGLSPEGYEQEADRVASELTGQPAPHRSHDRDAFRAVDAEPFVREALRSPGQALDRTTRDRMERGFGHDFSQIRVHFGDVPSDAARLLHANAFTLGPDIVFGDGRYAPTSRGGLRLLAHELTHTIQQRSSGEATPLGSVTIDNRAVQKDADAEQRVKRVISRTVTDAQGAVTLIERQLKARIQRRRDDIQQMLDDAGSPKSAKGRARVEALKADLDKTLPDIIAKADSRHVSKDLRNDIVESDQRLKQRERGSKTAQAQWSRFDPIFAGTGVAKALGADSIGPDELKSMVAEESSELVKWSNTGEHAGIAGLSPGEVKLAKGKPGDRKIPEKSIVILATVVHEYTRQMDAQLTKKPVGVERKKFIMGAYNIGVHGVTVAQSEAIKMGRGGLTWDSLLEGGEESPMHKAILEVPELAADAVNVWTQISTYIDRVMARIPQQP